MIKNIFIAMTAGTCLSLMIQINGYLAYKTTPLFASWVVHGIGAITALIILRLEFNLLTKSKNITEISQNRRPHVWLYLGGISGAFTVILASIALNGGVSLSSVISLGLVGQILFGIISDHFGLFNTQKRHISQIDIYVILLVIVGSIMILGA